MQLRRQDAGTACTKAGLDAQHYQVTWACNPRNQDHPWLHNKFKTNLCYLRSYLKNELIGQLNKDKSICPMSYGVSTLQTSMKPTEKGGFDDADAKGAAMPQRAH